MTRREDLDRFYALLKVVEGVCGGRRTLSACDRNLRWPERGVYFFFEDGEFRQDGATPRVVRVGTHALRPARSTLWSRLAQHQGQRGGSYAGGGNHRGSIFRRHVGIALADRDGCDEAVRASWGRDSTADGLVRRLEHQHETRVSQYLGRMNLIWIEVDDPPSKASDRGVIESNAIALLSNMARPTVDPPAQTWLGRHSDRDVIRESGLWNVNHVRDTPSEDLFTVLERHLGSRR